MKIISWNVNGIRSVLGKGFSDWLASTNADLVCLQETKINEKDLSEHVPSFAGYASYWNPATRPGYSGVAILTRRAPLAVRRGIGRAEFDGEGRVLMVEYEKFFLVNVYVPNSQMGAARMPFRLAWDEALRLYLSELLLRKSVIVAGDFNVALSELDVGVADASRMPGCSSQERESFEKLLGSGFVDSLRALRPLERCYSWWSYGEDARSWNRGLRFDYLLVSEALRSSIRLADTHRDVEGSDHGPVSLDLDLDFGEAALIAVPVTPTGQIGFGF